MSAEFILPKALGISVCGTPAQDLERVLESRRGARLASGKLTESTIGSVETGTFRPVPVGRELDPVAIERLRRLCQLWEVRLLPYTISSHRKFVGPIIVFFKRALFRLLAILLKDTLQQQRAFNAEVVRALAEISSVPVGSPQNPTKSDQSRP